jgi:predicted metal-binding protein
MHVLSVCRTCPRERAEKGGIAERLRALKFPVKSPSASRFQMLSVECLGGCLKPCNVAFDAPGKWRVRFSGLTAANAADLVEAARAYAASADGRLTDEALPPALRGRISALSPKFAPAR